MFFFFFFFCVIYLIRIEFEQSENRVFRKERISHDNSDNLSILVSGANGIVHSTYVLHLAILSNGRIVCRE